MEKSKSGRPSKYVPEMCELVIEYGKQGMGMAEMAAELGISRNTLHKWIKQKPVFGDAIKEARDRSQAWWEAKGRRATFASKDFNATSYIFQMKNRFPDDWRDKQNVEHGGELNMVIETGVPEKD